MTRARQVAVLTAAATTAAAALTFMPAPGPHGASGPPLGVTAAAAVGLHDDTQGYPRQTELPEPPVDPSDASIKLGLAAYHDIAPRLNAAQASSDRVSAEIIGQSTAGRDLVLVTLTAPESVSEASAQATMRDQIRTRPAQAARERHLLEDYKAPVLFNGNIHGNEWEGTDALLRLVEDYATSTDPAVQDVLEQTRLHLIISVNPDGRVDNDRRNGAGFDLNRDYVTVTQPETVAVREVIVATQPVVMLDLHGYVNGTLVEPTTPPHGENYEYDLFVKHAYPNGLAMEEAINGLGYDGSDEVSPVQIPLRDWDEGWDDWPPIFTPQYAALHGAVAHTIEVPLRVNNASYDLPEAELRRRSAINTDIAHAAVAGSIDYVMEHRAELLADQQEIFRRGVDGEPQQPVEDGLFGIIGPEDVYLTDYPRAFVIPAGAAQRSAPAAARLVDLLVDNGVEVKRLESAATIDGTLHPAGTYVVDMHQGRRGMANTILGPGTDISDRVDAMYDISGWSHALLWGADVVRVQDGELPPLGEPIAGADPTGVLPPSTRGWTLNLDDVTDVAALNTLLDLGVRVGWIDDGRIMIPGSAAQAAQQIVDEHGVVLRAAGAMEAASNGARDHGARPRVDSLSIGVAGTPEELWAFTEMGFVTEPIGTAALNAGMDLSELDALYVSSGLSWAQLTPEARTELEEFVADGGGYVGRGRTGAAINDALGLLEATAVNGRSDANAVVSVDNLGGPLTARAPKHTFVYSPVWFTGLGEGVQIEQWYAADPVVSGHWRPSGNGSGGPDQAAGQALVISGTSGASEARAVLIGSEPLFRAHPKGQYPLVARALVWGGLN